MSDITNAVTADKLTVPYNPNLLVTYKAIAGTYAAPEEPTYLTDKVTELEWSLHNGRQYKDNYYKLSNKINQLDELIVEWSNPNYDKDEVLLALCEHFDINPSKEIEFDAMISVSGTVAIPFNELEDFDIESYLMEEISVDSNNGNIEISDWSVDRINSNE